MTLRGGLVRAGLNGSLHARVLSSGDATDLAWIADPDQAAGERLAQRDASKGLPEPETGGVGAVVIAAPRQVPHAPAMAVIDAGLPLLVEKPIADTLAHAEEVIEA